MQDDGISVNKNALENAKIHRLEKNMHGPEALRCSGPDEDSAHVAVVCAKEIKEQSKTRGARLGLEHTTSWIEEQSADQCDAATCWCKKGRA